ncbi:polygalacturonase-like [Hibiscus syriacus]|uniref:Polygalacturonase-like n=1 Tax=Hibiscus syriacus TaxID=106335 RepID=A0A6A3BWX3_HIBSY|nr:BSD domain-containing protein 1-like [Hibiscus syriacus]KAE8721340.1 polygalacturonase-like [Hibiscus syriacus]
MDFFRSVFADDDDIQSQPSHPTTDPYPNPGSNATWSFGGLIKTLAEKSESVVESYRKDFEEFGSGLKKETEIIRSVASRAVNDSLEIGATVAQEKLESVGQAIDDIGISVWKSTSQIISHGKDSFLSPSDDDNSDSGSSSNRRLSIMSNNSINGKRYSRFEMQIRVLQSDRSTYCMEPEDLEDFENWKLGFNLEEKKGEIEDLLSENPVIRNIFKGVDSDEGESKRYWCNYFYKLNRLMKAEEARAKLVNRAISGEDEENLSWDIDEDEEENSGNVNTEEGDSSKDVDKGSKIDEEKVGSCKDSDVSVVSSLSMPEEEGWDAIEDIQSINDNKGEDVGNSTRVDLRKRLTVAEEEEDLSWDIDDEEEDQPVKS